MSKIIEKLNIRPLVIMAIILCLGVIGGAVAYFTDADNAVNTLAVGINTIDITEEFEPPEEIKPGVRFKKDVKVLNVEGCDCYVRVKAVFDNSHMEQYCTVDWKDSIWVYNESDGYWYYPEIISEGESTPSLFTTVAIAEDAPEYAMADFNIIVYAESVESYQGQGFSSYVEAWQHYQENKTK